MKEILNLQIMNIEISKGVTIIDEAKFLETHILRSTQSGMIAQPFKDRLELYYKLKADETMHKMQGV